MDSIFRDIILFFGHFLATYYFSDMHITMESKLSRLRKGKEKLWHEFEFDNGTARIVVLVLYHRGCWQNCRSAVRCLCSNAVNKEYVLRKNQRQA